MSENKGFCSAVIPSKDTKILEFYQRQKFDKTSIIYVDLECLVEKVGWCRNNSKQLSTWKIGENIPSWYSMSTVLTFDGIKKAWYMRKKKCRWILECCAYYMCNLKYRIRNEIPIALNNGSNYD